MYTVSVRRKLTARHFLAGAGRGGENEQHAHTYRIEVTLEGAEIGRDGYLVDVVDLESAVDALLDRFDGALLNDLPEFADLNPSMEHFARIVCEGISAAVDAPRVSAVSVAVRESDAAAASFRLVRQ